MESGFLQKQTRAPGGQKLQFRKRILLFSVFLFISVIIWLLNALSESYTTQITYPLEYNDLPKERILMGERPDALQLRVNARGYAILRYRIFRRPVPISFRVSSFTLNRMGSDTSGAYILTRYLRDQVTSQLPPEMQLADIKPDTLHFRFARSATKKVAVRPLLEFEVDDRFTIRDGIILDPDSVRVTGPDIVLDTLQALPTVRRDLGLLSRDFSEKVRLQEMENLSYAVDKVNCTIELERFTEVQLSIPVVVLNEPDTISLQTFPSRIKLTCRVGLSKYDRMDKNLFKAVVDYREIGERTRALDVTIQNVPDYLLGFDYYPKSVEFLKTVE